LKDSFADEMQTHAKFHTVTVIFDEKLSRDGKHTDSPSESAYSWAVTT